jgi:hypothetical protein
MEIMNRDKALEFIGKKYTTITDFIETQTAQMNEIKLDTTWAGRRKNASESAQEELEDLVKTVNSKDFSHEEFPEHCFKASAILYECGAPHVDWQLWNSAGVAAALLLNDRMRALRYALLSGEFAVLKTTPFEIVAKSNDAEIGLLLVLFKGPPTNSELFLHFFKDFWFEVCSGIVKSAFRNDRRYLKEYVFIYMKWYENKMRDWHIHEPFLYPDFEPILCSWIVMLLELGFLEVSDLKEYQEFVGPATAPRGEPLIKVHD